jgi:hypothetical protein
VGDDVILDFTPGADRLNIHCSDGIHYFEGMDLLDSNGDRRVDARDGNVDTVMVEDGDGARASLRLDISGSLDRLGFLDSAGDAVLTVVGVTRLAPEDFV